MQVKFKRKELCRDKPVSELEEICKTCELNAVSSTHGCVATIFTEKDEEFFRVFVRAYIYAKQKQSGAYIIPAIEQFGRKNKISGDIYTIAFHFFFWRKKISPTESRLMVHAIKEMRDLAQKKFETADEKQNWGKVAVALEKYTALLEKSSKLNLPLSIQ